MGCPAAVQATAKGMFPETHPQYLGIYWGVVSSHRVATRLKHADALLIVGTLSWHWYVIVAHISF